MTAGEPATGAEPTLDEFALIDAYFARPVPRADMVLGPGDDCALFAPPAGQLLAMSIDTLVAGVHFLSDADPANLGYKALAVNLSDLAAMGAEPAWATMALTLPTVDRRWLAAFSASFQAIAAQYRVALAGGDLSRGPLAVTVQVTGFVPRGEALQRAGAQPGDAVYVSGTVGDAAAGLQVRRGCLQPPSAARHHLLGRLDRPAPRIKLGYALRGIASAAIDISDGLVADLAHILQQSAVPGAAIDSMAIPLSTAYRACLGDDIDAALSGGDDYELCFTVPPDRTGAIPALAAALNLPLTCIGRLDADRGVRLRLADGREKVLQQTGFRHFTAAS